MIQAIVIFILAAFLSEQTDAETPLLIPDAQKWSSELKYDEMKDVQAPLRILLLESLVGKRDGNALVKALEFDSAACAQTSYISCVNAADFNYALLINKIPGALTANKIMDLTGVNAVIYPNKGRVVFVGASEKVRKELQGIDQLTPNMDAKLVLNRMLYTLGYDGVVLGIKGDFILVGTLEERLQKPGLQGLLLKDSGSNVFIKTKESRVGAALISLVGQHHGYAVFKIAIKASSFNMAIGQKVVFEGQRDDVSRKFATPTREDSIKEGLKLDDSATDPPAQGNIKPKESNPRDVESTKPDTHQVNPGDRPSSMAVPPSDSPSK